MEFSEIARTMQDEELVNVIQRASEYDPDSVNAATIELQDRLQKRKHEHRETIVKINRISVPFSDVFMVVLKSVISFVLIIVAFYALTFWFIGSVLHDLIWN